MSQNDETAPNAPGEHSLKTLKQARYGARLVVLVLGLISVVVFGVVGASFFMEKNKDLNLNIVHGCSQL